MLRRCRNVACVQPCLHPHPNLHHEHGPLSLARLMLMSLYIIHTHQCHGAYYCKQWPCALNIDIDALSHRLAQTNAALSPSQNCTTSINTSCPQFANTQPSAFILQFGQHIELAKWPQHTRCVVDDGQTNRRQHVAQCVRPRRQRRHWREFPIPINQSHLRARVAPDSLLPVLQRFTLSPRLELHRSTRFSTPVPTMMRTKMPCPIASDQKQKQSSKNPP